MWNALKAGALLSKGGEKKSSGALSETGGTHTATPHTVDGDVAHDDDKTKKKVLPGTPDKPVSPGILEGSKNLVINNEEIQKLAIKDEDLANLRKSMERKPLEGNEESDKKTFAVKKSKPQERQKMQKSKNIVVARVAPPNAQLKPIDYSGPSGPRYTKAGHIISHSVLGPVENFIEEAVRRNEMRADSPSVLELPSTDNLLETKKYERPTSRHQDFIPTALDQERALLNWRRKMADRKRQQGYISSLLQKPPDRLLMNQDDKFREIQEKRHLVDRSIPAIDYGKGYRVGSEFWRQHESFGDDLTGIKMTLTKTERGNPVDFEHIGKPVSVQYEVGKTREGERPTVDPRRTWHSSKYLKQRTRQLQPVMNELDPYKPDLDNLEVIGNEDDNHAGIGYRCYDGDVINGFEAQQKIVENDPLSKYPDVRSKPVIGPSIVFNGTSARWSGSSIENKDKVGMVTRVTFEAMATERTSSHLVVENDGTTAIYYEWRKVPKPPTFESLKSDPVQRFYFNTGEGVILPGETTKVPFIFKSPNSGIFTETWELLTKPCVMGGASLQAVLKGVALQDDSTTEERMKIERELEAREARVVVRRIIDDIIRGIQSPARSPSPIDAYITEEESFMRKNRGYYYDHETIVELKNIYLQLFAEEDREGREWNLSLDELQSCVTAVPDEEARDELLTGLNAVIQRLAFPPLTPLQRLMYSAGYKFWQDAIDKIVGCSMMIRSIMGLPEVVMSETVSEPEISAETVSQPAKPDPKGLSAKSHISQESSQGKPAKDDKKAKGKKSTGKEAKEDKGKKGGKKDTKEKERPKSKDAKGKGGKAAQSPTKDMQADRDIGSKTPSSVRAIPTDTLDVVTRIKYTEKMYGQVYELLLEMVDDMTLAFEDAKSNQ